MKLSYREEISYEQLKQDGVEELIVLVSGQSKKELLEKSEFAEIQVSILELPKKQKHFMYTMREFMGKIVRSRTGSFALSFALIEEEYASEVETFLCYFVEAQYQLDKKLIWNIPTRSCFELRNQLIGETNEQQILLIGTKLTPLAERALRKGESINYARLLGDLPNNFMNQVHIVDYCHDLSKAYGLEFELIEEEGLKEFGGILGVGAGSERGSALIAIKYKGGKAAEEIAVIGKGVMFDTGGYHIKSAEGMDGMKYDMCGAANVISIIEMVAREKLQINLTAYLPIVENEIGPKAMKMGDVIKMYGGKTVEVVNMDAEGRLILADAISYAIEKGAKRIITLATLTYSCQGALGDDYIGVFTNDSSSVELLRRAADKVGEKMWELPLDESFKEPLLDSQVADIKNYSLGARAGASVAAGFLEEFVEEGVSWIHMDMVGPSVQRSKSEGRAKGATGAGILSVYHLLEGMSNV